MMGWGRSLVLLRTGLIVIGWLTVSATFAAEIAVIEEIIVTAQKRQEYLSDLGFSANVVTSTQLQEQSIVRLQDAMGLIAGVQVQDSSSTTPYYVIRGIGPQDFLGNTAPSAAVHIDGVYKASNVNSGPLLFDIERIEILKGPQGTLYGRNNTAGTINIVTTRPDFDNDVRASVGYGEYNHITLKGVIGGPLFDDFAYRFSGIYELSDGFIENIQYGPAPAPDPGFPGVGNALLPGDVGGDIGDIDRWALRSQLLYESDPNSSLLFKIHYSKDKSEAWPYTMIGTGLPVASLGTPSDVLLIPTQCGAFEFEPVTGNLLSGRPDSTRCTNSAGANDPNPHDFKVSSDFVGSFNNDIYGVSLLGEKLLDSGRFTSISAYEGFDWQQTTDYDGTSAKLRTLQGTGISESLTQWSQEFRLEVDSDPSYFRLFGLYTSYDEVGIDGGLNLDFDGNLANGSGLCNIIKDFALPFLLGNPLDPPNDSCIPGFTPFVSGDLAFHSQQKTTSFAFFFDQDWYYNDALTLHSGFRYTYEKRRFESESAMSFDDGSVFMTDLFGPVLGGIPATTSDPRVEDKISTDDLSWRLGFNYTPNAPWNMFVTGSRSFKSGGWDGNFVIDGTLLDPYSKEKVTSIELGIRSRRLNDRLRYGVSVFRSEYEDPQLRKNILISGTIPNGRLDNIDGATVDGLEIELDYQATPRLNVSGTASFLSTETRDYNEEFANLSETAARYYDNKRLPFAPLQAYSLLLQYQLGQWSKMTPAIRLHIDHVGDHYLDTANLDFEKQQYTLFNAQFSLRSRDDRLSVTLWGKNLTNEHYFTSVLTGFSARIYSFNRPRQVGITVDYRFH